MAINPLLDNCDDDYYDDDDYDDDYDDYDDYDEEYFDLIQ